MPNRGEHQRKTAIIATFALSWWIGTIYYLIYQNLEIFLLPILGIYFLMLGSTLPDWDHHMVQKKKIYLKPLIGRTKHRGHWHSFITMAIYGLIISLITIWFLHYWWICTVAGMFGFLMHLVEDQVHKVINGSQAKRTLKLW